MADKAQDWNSINKTVNKITKYLKSSYPSDVESFLRWYNSLNKRRATKIDFINWLKRGNIYMRIIIKDLNKGIIKASDMLSRIERSNETTQSKLEKIKQYNDIVTEIDKLIIELLGCRNGIGRWYIGLLKKYNINNNNQYNDFYNTCLSTRLRLNRKKN